MDDNWPSITRGLPVRTKSIVIIKPWGKVLVTAVVGWANLVLPCFVRAPKDPVIPLCHFERQFAQKEMWVYRVREIHVTGMGIAIASMLHIFLHTFVYSFSRPMLINPAQIILECVCIGVEFLNTLVCIHILSCMCPKATYSWRKLEGSFVNVCKWTSWYNSDSCKIVLQYLNICNLFVIFVILNNFWISHNVCQCLVDVALTPFSTLYLTVKPGSTSGGPNTIVYRFLHFFEANYKNTQFLVLLLLFVTKTACAMDLGNGKNLKLKKLIKF